MGVNVEGDLEAEEIVHTFALSKDENKSNDRNIVLTIRNSKRYEENDYRPRGNGDDGNEY